MTALGLEEAAAATRAEGFHPDTEELLLAWLDAGWVDAVRDRDGQLGFRPTEAGARHLDDLLGTLTAGPS